MDLEQSKNMKQASKAESKSRRPLPAARACRKKPQHAG